MKIWLDDERDPALPYWQRTKNDMYFKVTNNDNSSLYSRWLGKYAVQYKLNEWVYPKIGPLMCYHSSHLFRYGDVVGFDEYQLRPSRLINQADAKIFVIEVQQPKHCRLTVPILSDAKKYIGQIHVAEISTIEAVICTGIKLIQELQPEEFYDLATQLLGQGSCDL